MPRSTNWAWRGTPTAIPCTAEKDRALCLFSIEDARALNPYGLPPLDPGAFGENLLVEGLDFALLRPGHRLSVGPEVLLEIFDVREPCKTLKEVDPRFPALMEGKSGFVARVLQNGRIAPGQAIQLQN